MSKHVSKTLLLTGISLILLSGCRKEKPECTDPPQIYISYTWEYYEQTNSTGISADFRVGGESGIHAANCEPFSVTFNGDTFYRQAATYYLTQHGLMDSGTLVYTDITGARYSTEIKPIQVPLIPDTFTSVNRHGGYYFYWVGDSTGNDENIQISFCNKDSFTCYAPTAYSLSYGIELWDMGLLLPVGTNNTNAALTLERNKYDIPAGAPRGACLKQKVYGRSKTISVY